MVLNTLQTKNRNLKKTVLTLVSAGMRDEYPLHLGFVETAKECTLNIYLNSHLRFSRFQNQGITAWMNLMKYLKNFIEYVDVQKIQTMVIDFGKNRRSNNADEKNRLIVSMLLMLMSEKSVLVRTYLGGYTVKFLDYGMRHIKSVMEKLSKEYTEKVKNRQKLCQITRDKLVEIFLSKLHLEESHYESGTLFRTSNIQNPVNVGVTSGRNSLPFELNHALNSLVEVSPFSLPTPAMTSNRKNSPIVPTMLQPQGSGSYDEDQAEMPRITDDSPFKTGSSGVQSRPESPFSKHSFMSPVIKDRYNRMSDPTSALISFDELIGLLEDNRTNLGSIYNSRKVEKKLKSKSKLIRSDRPNVLTYPRIFRLNPILVAMVFKDSSIGKRKPFVVFYLSMELPDFETVEFNVDLAVREMVEHQSSTLLPVADFIEQCRMDATLVGNAVQMVKRGSNLKKSVKLALLEQLAASITVKKGKVATKHDDKTLVNYLLKKDSTESPTRIRVVSKLAKGVAKINTFNLMKHSTKKNAKPTDAALKQTSKNMDGGQLEPLSRLSGKKAAYVRVDKDLLPQTSSTYRLKMKGTTVLLTIACYELLPQTILLLKLYRPDMNESFEYAVTSPTEINRICTMVRTGTHTLQETALGFLLKAEQARIGGRIFLQPRNLSIKKNSTDQMTPQKIMDLLWQVDSQRDILLRFDKVTYTLLVTDEKYGRMMAMCHVYYTFRNRDCYMAVDTSAIANRNIIFKMVISKVDVCTHVHPHFMDILFDRGAMLRHLQAFLKKVIFERSPLYSRPIILYKRTATGHVLSRFSKTYKKPASNGSFLEQRKIEREVIGQFTLRYENTFILATVFRHQLAKQHDIELYFPRTQKRFLFEMFNDELLRIDKAVVAKIYQVSSAEIMFLAGKTKFDYKELLETIRGQAVGYVYQD